MQATTSGVTLNKVDVYGKKSILDFLNREKAQFYKLKNKTALYQNKVSISTAGLNYLNVLPENNIELTVKNMILKEYNDCEKLYPYLGDVFLHSFFENKYNSKNIFRFEKRDQKKFLETIKDNCVKNVLTWIFDNTNLEEV